VVVAGSLVTAWLIHMTFFGVVDRPPQAPSPTGVPVRSGPENPLGVRITGAVIFVWLALSVVAAIRLGRNNAMRFRDLSPADQTRRHEAGELLKQPRLAAEEGR
jgi:hypothetical protein